MFPTNMYIKDTSSTGVMMVFEVVVGVELEGWGMSLKYMPQRVLEYLTNWFSKFLTEWR